MAAPGTGWAERLEPGEPARHAEAARALVAMQQAKSKRFGNGRALHRKPIVALKGTLRVLDGVPAHLRHGLFERLGGYHGTLHHNVHYHLGLALFLCGDLELAERAWLDCLAVAGSGQAPDATGRQGLPAGGIVFLHQYF